jgi:SAM-dependent methyltransferase
MTIEETTDFYDKESIQYSQKRYHGVTESYYQYLFKGRLALFLKSLSSVLSGLPEDASLLEVGCADGVVLRAIEETFPKRFSKIVGVDISPKMIEQSVACNRNHKAHFCLREQLPPEEFDTVIELGVHPVSLVGELLSARAHLKSGSYFFYDLAGRHSLHSRFKLKGVSYVNDYRSYREYDKVIAEHFEIISTKNYGFFIPKLWAFPRIARILQPIIDWCLCPLFPELSHEKMYILKKKV